MDPSATSNETSSRATMPPNSSRALSSARRPIRAADTIRFESGFKALFAMLTGGEVLGPELLHRRRPRRLRVRRVVRRVVDSADDPVAARRHVEDVEAARRLLEAPEEDALAGERSAEDGAVDGAVEDEQEHVPVVVGEQRIDVRQDAVEQL